MALSEFELIDIIRQECTLARADVVLGNGDDAAVLQVPPGQHLVACTDMLIAGRHFPLDTAPEDIGWKALAVNLSDLAAMGARPAWCLLALSLPSPDAEWLRAFARGFAELAAQHQIALVGGDTTRGPLSVTVTALGLIPAGSALTRAGAAVGDRVLICGRLGWAAAGLSLRLGGALAAGASDPAGSPAAQWIDALNRPVPLVAAGQALRGIASSAIDISDGLLADLGHVLRASGVGAELRVEQMPGHSELRQQLGSERARDCMLAGGDDYALCFTVPVERVDDALAALQASGAGQVADIGCICAGSGVVVLDAMGQAINLERRGWDHFG
jgi:thiamine-monophosphate kinase